MAPDAQIDLAATAPFTLGALTVEPSTLRVIAGQVETLEPRVMQVLVALKQAGGATVSRDQLIERCWAGRVVGDDAINRVIGRLRKLAESNGGAGFRIETVPRVGYRLIDEQSAETATHPVAPHSTQRWRVVATGAIALAALGAVAGGAWWLRPRPVEPVVTLAPFTGPREAVGTLRREMLASNIAGLEWTTGDGAPYRLSGALADRALFVELNGPAGVLWRSSIAANSAQPAITAQYLGNIVECIVEPIGTRQPERRFIAAFAKFCEENIKPSSDRTRQLVYLRAAAADPGFIEANRALATGLGVAATRSPPEDAAALRREGMAAAANAAKGDPDAVLTRYAFFMLAERTDFTGRAAEIARMRAADRPENSYAYQAEGHFLNSTGQIAGALTAHQRALALFPNNSIDGANEGRALARLGRYDDARRAFTRQATVHGLHPRLASFWLESALAAGDWTAVDRLVEAGEGDERFRGALRRLAVAKLDGNGTAISAAGAQLAALAASPGSLSAAVAIALAAAGRDDDALIAVNRLFTGDDGWSATGTLYWPIFDRARRLPAFTNLVTRFGLLNYWRSGAWPDFCRAPDAPRVCRRA